MWDTLYNTFILHDDNIKTFSSSKNQEDIDIFQNFLSIS